MITWNNEVLMKLVDNMDRNILVEKFGELYSSEILFEIYSKTISSLESLENDSNRIEISSIMKEFLVTVLPDNKQEVTIREFIDNHSDDNTMFFLEK